MTSKMYKLVKKRYDMPEGHPAKWSKKRVSEAVSANIITPMEYLWITNEEWVDPNPPQVVEETVE